MGRPTLNTPRNPKPSDYSKYVVYSGGYVYDYYETKTGAEKIVDTLRRAGHVARYEPLGLVG